MLQRIVDPRRLAYQDISESLVLTLSHLPRFAEAVLSLNGHVAVEVRFYRDEQRRLRVSGHITAECELTCQRCMNGMPYHIDADFELMIVVSDEKAQMVPKSFEPWIVADKGDLYEVIEDELLLALPYVLYHEEGECSGLASFQTADDDASVEQDKDVKANPFAILQALKKD